VNVPVFLIFLVFGLEMTDPHLFAYPEEYRQRYTLVGSHCAQIYEFLKKEANEHMQSNQHFVIKRFIKDDAYYGPYNRERPRRTEPIRLSSVLDFEIATREGRNIDCTLFFTFFIDKMEIKIKIN